MNDWVTRTHGENGRDALPPCYSNLDFLKELQRRVEYAESLRPSTVLKLRNNFALILAENKVIISDKNPDKAALVVVDSALQAAGQSAKSAKKIVSAWAHARAEIPKVKQRVLN